MKKTNTENTEEKTVQNGEEVAKKKIFTYVRVSKKDSSINTFDAQITAIRSFMRRNNLSQYEEVAKEEEHSAFKEGRPKFNDMLKILDEDILKGDDKEYIGIVFFDVSRMARNSADFVKIEELVRAGYKIYSASENIIDSPAGKYFFRMIQMESIYYSDRQSSKSQRYNLTILCSNPYAHTGGNGITYGYNKGGTKIPIISVHPVNSLIVKAIYELSLKGHTGGEIEQILKGKFQEKVDIYNSKIGKVEIPDENENDDIEDAEKDQEKFTAIEEGEYDETISSKSIPAYIPHKKKISEILTGKGRIKYNGHRDYTFSVNFEEDIPLFNAIILGQENGGKTPFKFQEGKTLKKGKQTIIMNVREKLTIIENWLFLEVTKKENAQIEESKKHIQIYKGLIFCSCGRHILGAIEGDRMGYWCSILSEKRRKMTIIGSECERTTKITEKELDKIFMDTFLSKISIGHQVYSRGGLSMGLHSGRITEVINQLRSENAALTVLKKRLTKYEDEDELTLKKIKRKEMIIANYEIKKEEFKKEAIREEEFIFRNIENYLNAEKDTKQAIAEFVLQKIILDEPHDGENSRYHNKKNTTGKPQWQKKIVDFELTPYFKMLYDLGKYHSEESK